MMNMEKEKKMSIDDEIRFNEAFAREQWNRDHATPYDDEEDYPDHDPASIITWNEFTKGGNVINRYEMSIEKMVIDEESNEIHNEDGTEYYEIPLCKSDILSLYKSLKIIVSKWEEEDARK